MIGIVVLAVAVALLVAFVLGIVTGAHIASGRGIRWRAQNHQAAAEQALTAELTALRAELAARAAAPQPIPQIPHAVIAVLDHSQAPEGWHRPALRGAAPSIQTTERRSLEEGDHK